MCFLLSGFWIGSERCPEKDKVLGLGCLPQLHSHGSKIAGYTCSSHKGIIETGIST
jgi:hypothetical protein